MKKMKKVLIPTCFQTTHSRMSSQTLYGIQTIQNEIYCNAGEDYTVVNSEQNEVLHQRCSSKSSGTSSVDTFTIKARMENLEIALTMLNENFQRMENAMNKQIERAIEIIIGTTEKDEKDETVFRTKDKYFMKSENKKLMKAVKFLTESSRIMRTALSEHTKFIDHITSVINQPTEPVQVPLQRRDESPVERVLNKYKKQRDRIQIIHPKPVNPMEVSDYLSVEDTTRSATTKSPCHFCKLNNKQPIWNNSVWEPPQQPTCLYVNFNKDTNAILKCNCRLCSLAPSVDPDGDYVTLLKDYISNGKCNAAYEYYNKTSLPDLTIHTNVNEDEHTMFTERKGTLV